MCVCVCVCVCVCFVYSYGLTVTVTVVVNKLSGSSPFISYSHFYAKKGLPGFHAILNVTKLIHLRTQIFEIQNQPIMNSTKTATFHK